MPTSLSLYRDISNFVGTPCGNGVGVDCHRCLCREPGKWLTLILRVGVAGSAGPHVTAFILQFMRGSSLNQEPRLHVQVTEIPRSSFSCAAIRRARGKNESYCNNGRSSRRPLATRNTRGKHLSAASVLLPAPFIQYTLASCTSLALPVRVVSATGIVWQDRRIHSAQWQEVTE